MYVYLIKCSIYYKIGYSKNPKVRLKTVKTHNPFNVDLVATLKNENYLSIEKELHKLFINKNSLREWFELNEDDLNLLKIDYGFNFIIPINDLLESSVKNNHILNEVKDFRIDNYKVDRAKEYFENLFDCSINDLRIIKKICSKYDSNIIRKSMQNLCQQYHMTNQKAYLLLPKVCENYLQMETNPAKHIASILNAIYIKQYGYRLHQNDLSLFIENYNFNLVPEDVIKEMNINKFQMDDNEFYDFVLNNFTIAS